MTTPHTQAIRALAALAGFAFALGASSIAGAQQADVIRGRVTNGSGAGLPGATISASAIPSNITKATKADRNGRFGLTFPNGEGDYWITVTAIGYTQRRFELKRVADEDVLIADIKLEGTGVVLDSVRVNGDRARVGRNDNTDVSGTEKSVGVGAVDPSQAGNLAAMAASLPGVQLIPGADGNPDQFSVFGLSGDQNRTTLNGLGFGAADIPRDAATRSSLGVTPWDVSRGGFSGGVFSLRTQSGSNFSTRGMSSLINAPALQWTDQAGRASGAEYTSISLGGATGGPVSMDESFYNAGYQLDRRSAPLQSLALANAMALSAAGVAQDSVARLRSILSGLGVPQAAAGLPSSRVSQRAMLLGSFDVAPPTSTSGQALNITAVGSVSQLGAPLSRVTSLSTTDLQSTSWFGSLQARHTTYLPNGMLSETSAGLSRVQMVTDPYLAMPSGSVRVNSVLDGGELAISQLGFGGSTIQATTSGTTTLAAQNQLSWFSLDSKHRLKLTSEVRYDGVSQDLTANPLGTFVYNSLADLEAGRAAMFSRSLSPRVTKVGSVNGALALGDSYRPTADLQIQFGIRADANRFLDRPMANAALDSALGLSNANVPNRIYLSPRAGFSWTYGTAPQVAIANGFTRGPRAVVRGGVGLFQGTAALPLVGSAIGTTGLASAVQQVGCVGSAVPVADWNSYRTDPSTIPTTCANGSTSGGFATSAPNVALVSGDFTAARSVRANLNWSGTLPGNRFVSSVDGTYSLNVNQPGIADRNFDPTPQFALTGEGNRPVYAAQDRIVSGTGAISSQASRVSSAFSRVIEQQSDLRSVSRQISVGVRPAAFSSSFGWSLTYVYSNTRDLASGFSTTNGDPRTREWGRSGLDSRHQIVYGLSYNLLNLFPISLNGSLRSGRPYTPTVAGDINGDGFGNDRAFIYDPAASGVDAKLASDLQTLLAGSSSEARRCLESQIGRVAGRSSCQGPWIATSSLTIAVNPVKFRLPQRLNLSLFVNNAFGAADLLLNGQKNRKGWGEAIQPEQTLLFVRGFDPVTQSFKYEVNPRFGSTKPAQSVSRNPVVVTLQARIDIGYTRERQLLTQSLDRGRVRNGVKPSEQDISAMSASLVPPNPMSRILQQTDSLKLTRTQADSLATLNRVYSRALNATWAPVAKYLVGLPSQYNRKDAYARYRKARETSVDALIKLAPQIRGLLTAEQLRMLPASITSSLDTRYLASVRSSTAGGTDIGVLGMLAQMGWMGGSVDGSQGTQTIMVHR